ncbi:unnamed protein product [Rotaria sp. Silwood2]|nr:unnamed protein product [Rotaria sp. Silwood2]CAF4180069.1 unnamed protein product [Rotaria sp. Silwood2]
MGNGSFFSSSKQSKTDNHMTINDIDQRLALDFLYIDQKQCITIENRIRFLPKNTISTVVNEFLALEEQNMISSDKVVLVSISLGGRNYVAPKRNARITLQELEIKNGSLLCCEPLEIGNRCKSSQLILFSPYDKGKKKCEWNEKSTTVNMLLNEVIRIFALNSIDHKSIQLYTFLNENLNRPCNSEKKLSEFRLTNYSSIFVAIMKSNPFYNYDQDIKVLVTSNLHGSTLLYASLTDSIIELENQILRRFLPYYDIHVEFKNLENESLILNDSKQMLRELGIKSNDTINAIVRENLRKKQTTTMERRIHKLQSPLLDTKERSVYVQCKFSTQKPITIEVSAADTVAKVMAEITALKKDESRFQFRLYSETIEIDDKQPDRCLADFGIKPGNKIYANMIDTHSNNSSISNSQIDMLPRPPNTYQISSKPLGLVNLGNTCFMNSALQCLIHVAPLTKFFLDGFARVYTSGDHQDGYNPFDSCGDMTGAYAELIWNMRRPSRTDSDYISSFKPTRMKETIGYFAPSFATSDQQDAQEFITFLLDAMHDELKEKNKPDRNTIIQQLFFGTLLSKVTCLKCKHVQSTTNHIAFLPLSLNHQQRLFVINFITKDGIQDRTSVSVASNGRVENLVQRFIELNDLDHLFNRIVAIGKKSEEQLQFETPLRQLSEDEITLIEQDNYISRIQSNRFDEELINLKIEECLQGFVSPETLDDRWICQQKTCQQNTPATKQLQFKSLPRVVIIQLKRFSYANGLRRKLDTLVDCPTDGLDLSELLSSLSKNEKAIYDLIAVSNHIGSIYGGHYTAYAREKPSTDEWYEFNDSYVSTIYSKDQIISKDAYLLFYIKRTK